MSSSLKKTLDSYSISDTGIQLSEICKCIRKCKMQIRRDFLTWICFNPVEEKQDNLGTYYPGPFWTITKKMTAPYLVALLYEGPGSLNLEVLQSQQRRNVFLLFYLQNCLVSYNCLELQSIGAVYIKPSQVMMH